jgi:hypothetical protein
VRLRLNNDSKAAMANDDNNDEDPTPTPPMPTTANADANDDEGYTSAALNARELEWAVNPPQLVAEHKKFNGSVVRTRYDSTMRWHA